MQRLRITLAALIVLLSGLLIAHARLAQARCFTTGSSGNDDIVLCNQPPDAEGIDTGIGDDRIAIEIKVDMYTPQSTIVTGPGDDTVVNYGALRSDIDPIDLGTGRDVFRNFGTLNGMDDGAGCAPAPGEVCAIYNYGSVTAVYEALDYRGSGGNGYIYNEGTITSTAEEALHLRLGQYYEVINKGLISAGTSAVEVYEAQLSLTNHGTIETAGQNEAGRTFAEYAVNADNFDDQLTNTGTISNASGPALGMGGGSDLVQNSGTITATNTNPQRSAVMGEDGNDRIVTSGTIRELGQGHAAIEAGHGSDTVVIQGGIVDGLITGDHSAGSRRGDSDTLIFQFSGSQAEIDAFQRQVESQSERSGQAVWRGSTYTWQGFESIQLELTVSTP